MLTELHIKNFKSCKDLQLQPGRVTVLIGENGSGKSNILEGLAFASAAAADKLDHEFLASRGLRVPEPRFMRSAFTPHSDETISIGVRAGYNAEHFELSTEGEGPYARWTRSSRELPPSPIAELPLVADAVAVDLLQRLTSLEERLRDLEKRLFNLKKRQVDVEDLAQTVLETHEAVLQAALSVRDTQERSSLTDFLIYSPENTALRNFEQEGQILPLGIKGEGLFQLLKTLEPERVAELRDNLRLIDWFEDLQVPSTLAPFERTLRIRDRYLEREEDVELAYFDQRSSNEGFLFLLFYFALFVSPDTPKMFAIDNVDASLNPKLCTELMRRLVVLAKKYDKQVLITTHNPAVLDGLDLNDDEQRLFMVHRNSKGHTRARRVHAPKPLGDEPPVKLSEAFLRGLIGGLPQNF